VKFDLGGNNFIEFKTDVIGLENTAPVKSAKQFLPHWFKDIEDALPQKKDLDGPPNKFGKKKNIAKKWHQGTVKRCPAIVDLITEGYIIPMWCDFLIQRDKKIMEWDNKDFPYGIDFHGKSQIYNWPLKKTDFPEGVKFVNPWRIYTPKGYSVIFMTPTYQFEKRFTVLPGIVETDSYHHVNFPTIWHTTKDTVINRGTPFIHVIPFKREEWDLEVGQMTEKQDEKDKAQKLLLATKFKNAYRDIVKRSKN
tara:strand:+ start:2025 stop:2777 length:753 start_codon:yes stop_codon:yes gene_type:complete